MEDQHGSFLEIFGPFYGPRTFMLMVFHFFSSAFGYYGFASRVPTLLIAANGVGITLSLQYSFIIAISSPFALSSR